VVFENLSVGVAHGSCGRVHALGAPVLVLCRDAHILVRRRPLRNPVDCEQCFHHLFGVDVDDEPVVGLCTHVVLHPPNSSALVSPASHLVVNRMVCSSFVWTVQYVWMARLPNACRPALTTVDKSAPR